MGNGHATAQDWTVQTLLADMAGRGDEAAIMAFAGGACQTTSYGDLAHQALRLAKGLRHAGARPGERLLLIAPNGLDWIVVRLAAGAAGLMTVALDHLAQGAEIERLGQSTTIDWAFCDAGHLAAAAGMTAAGRLYHVSKEGHDDVKGRDTLGTDEGDLPPVDPGAPTVLSQTSGTTGAPKLFTLSHRHIWANVGALAAEGLVTPEDRLVLPLPLHHIYPQVVGLLTPLVAGATVVLPEAATGPALVEALAGSRATGIIGVPRLYDALISGLEARIARGGRLVRGLYRALMSASITVLRKTGVNVGRVLFRPLRRRLSPDLHLLVSGGARLDTMLTWKLAALGFDIRSGYGLAETASTLTGNLPGRERLGSEGRPFQGGEVKIDDPDASGAGEILLRGPNVMEGYLDPANNRDAFTADGWYRTGDIGRLDRDGFLYVTGRIKEAIVLGGGKKVNPEDLEKVYGQVPVIGEIAVLEHGGGLVALVRPDEAALAAGGQLDAQSVVRVALSQAGADLASHERLAGFALIRDPLPRTRLGKYQRFLLPELYERAKSGKTVKAKPSAADLELLKEPRAAAVWKLLNEQHGDRLGGLDDHLALDLGIDSLGWVSLSLAIQEAAGVDMSVVDPARLTTVRELIEAVQQAPAGAAAARADAEDVKRWVAPAPLVFRLLAAVVYGLNRVLVRLYFRLRVAGLEHLPERGPYVIAANHVSDLDPMVVAAALPIAIRRQTRWGAEATRLAGTTAMRKVYLGLRLFPLSETRPAMGLACAKAALAQGDVLVWFPESWRSPDGKLQEFRSGVGLLLEGTEVAVVPACIKGTFEAMPRTRKWPRPAPVTIRFGPSATAGELAGTGETTDRAARIAAALRSRVAAVCDSMSAGSS